MRSSPHLEGFWHRVDVLVCVRPSFVSRFRPNAWMVPTYIATMPCISPRCSRQRITRCFLSAAATFSRCGCQAMTRREAVLKEVSDTARHDCWRARLGTGEAGQGLVMTTHRVGLVG